MSPHKEQVDFPSLLKSAGIPFSTPESTDFTSLNESFCAARNYGLPSIVTVPETAEHVESIVSHCVANSLPIVVRGGGHDMYGRFSASSAVSIDLRNIKHVQVADDKKTIRVGGGATMLQVLERLDGTGVSVPTGTCGTVGFAGWCMNGGFGPYGESRGLGADQIVGARVVNAKGQLITADNDMLRGLRGGGGNMGVVVELTVKAWPSTAIQGGTLMFDSSDVPKTVKTFFTNYETLLKDNAPIPHGCFMQPMIVTIPGLGTTMLCNFVWNGPDDDKFRWWLEQLCNLAPAFPGMPTARDAIAETTEFALSQKTTASLPKKVFGTAQAAAAVSYSPRLVDEIANIVANITEGCQASICIHSIRAESPSIINPEDSVCPYRSPQIILELLALGKDKEQEERAVSWAQDARDRISSLEESLPRTYYPITSPGALDLEGIYGDKLEELKRLKLKYDPENVFKNAIPKVC